MPAAAVIPAPLACMQVVAVKKLVVGSQAGSRSAFGRVLPSSAYLTRSVCSSLGARVAGTFTLRKLECSKQAVCLNNVAWNNGIGPRFYFVGSRSRGND